MKKDLKRDNENESDAVKRIEERLRNLEVSDTPDYHFSLSETIKIGKWNDYFRVSSSTI